MTTGLSSPAEAVSSYRGIAHLQDGPVVGALVLICGGSAFVLFSKGELPGVGPNLAGLLWIGAVIFAVWAVLFRSRTPNGAQTGDRPMLGRGARAGVTVLFSTAVMISAFFLGSMGLRAVGLSELQLSVVIVAVGLHFVPFAAVLHPMFRAFGLAIVTIGLLSFLAGLVAGSVFVSLGGVVTGLFMICAMALGAIGMGGGRR